MRAWMWGLVLAAACGGTETRYGPEAAALGPPAPIWFYSARSGNFEIWRMQPDGSDLRQITDHPAFDSLPAPSPDGRRVAFQSNRDGNIESTSPTRTARRRFG